MKNFKTLTFLLFLLISFSSVYGATLTLVSPADKEIVTSLTPVLTWKGEGSFSSYKVRIFSMESQSLLHLAYAKDMKFEVPKDLLFDGVTYLWQITGYYLDSTGGNVMNKLDSGTFSFTVKLDGQADKEFKKTGQILYIPVEFSDVKHKSGWYKMIKDKAEGVFKFYEDVSFSNKKLLDNFKCDVYNEIITLDKTQENYGKDVQDGEKWITDLGNYSKPWVGSGKFKGSYEMKREALKQLFEKKVPVKDYKFLVYVVPGDNGNVHGSNQLWPVSNSAEPSGIIYVPFFKKVTGAYMSGFVIPVEKNVGTWRHEMGHQLGLPDLYPRDGKYEKVEMGSNVLMASGSHFDVGMTVISKKKGYSGALWGLFSTKKKEDWIKNKVKEVTSDGTYTLSSRDSAGDLLCILVKLKNKGGYYIVEVFDRNKWDKTLPAYIQPTAKVTGGVLAYYADHHDVEKIRTVYPLPAGDNPGNVGKFFLTGGVIDEGKGVKIEVIDVQDNGTNFTAQVKVDFE